MPIEPTSAFLSALLTQVPGVVQPSPAPEIRIVVDDNLP